MAASIVYLVGIAIAFYYLTRVPEGLDRPGAFDVVGHSSHQIFHALVNAGRGARITAPRAIVFLKVRVPDQLSEDGGESKELNHLVYCFNLLIAAATAARLIVNYYHAWPVGRRVD